mmetsp:Transcript_15940/g.39514  ORF Transcript_15940/g.39514 Transcript_15940/m.39514 type:complete len:86 (+) Transcript_15940:421-678(+)
MKAERERIGNMFGSAHPEYVRVSNRITRMKTPKSQKKKRNQHEYQQRTSVAAQEASTTRIPTSTYQQPTLTAIVGTKWSENKLLY